MSRPDSQIEYRDTRRLLAVWLHYLLSLSCFTWSAFAQPATDNWIFGSKAAVNVASGAASIAAPMLTSEGSSSISDSSGNLLFYTDGSKVWNRSHGVMTNGSGLLGNSSSTHSAMIVPCNCNKYFVFTTDAAEANYANGLKYSVVDMTLTGGLGNVVSTQKNLTLLASSTEKLAAITATGGGFWVVGHSLNENRFHAWRVQASADCQLNPQSAVISAVGTSYTGGSAETGLPLRAWTTASPASWKYSSLTVQPAWSETSAVDR